MNNLISLLLLSLLVVSCSSPTMVQPPETADCLSEGQLDYLCGPEDTEDMLFIPKTPWMVASGIGFSKKPGSLYLINTENKTWNIEFPTNLKTTKQHSVHCPSAPDQTLFSPHGLGINHTKKDDQYELYVVNHGGREAVEIFDINISNNKPQLVWKDCVILPDNVHANSVTPLPDGGFLFTKFFDTRISDMFSIAATNNMGEVIEWQAETGFSTLPETRSLGTNGIIVSEDGQWVFFAAWGSNEVIRISRGQTPLVRDVIALDFLPDNLRWSPSGNVIIAGQNSSPAFGCEETTAGCKPGWKAVYLNPNSLKTKTIFSIDNPKAIESATVAAENNGVLWIGTYHADRIGYVRISGQ